jgi:hypothetical protein
MRMPELWRPWLAVQVMRRDFIPRRVVINAAVYSVLVILPQAIVQAHDGDRWGLALVAGWLALLGLGWLLMRSLAAGVATEDWRRRRILGYHGVTADGVVVPPRRLGWQRPTVAMSLLAAQVVVVVTGVSFAAVRSTDDSPRCVAVSSSDLTQVTAAVGVPLLPGLGPPGRVADGTLSRVRELDPGGGGVPGMRYLSAVVVDEHGRQVGRGVWTVLRVTSQGRVPQVFVSAANDVAYRVTPTLGESTSVRPDPNIARAAACLG